jgi:hypothetical protein
MSVLGLLSIMRDALSTFNAAVTAIPTLRRFTNYLPRWALILFTLVGGSALFEGWMAEEQGGHPQPHNDIALFGSQGDIGHITIKNSIMCSRAGIVRSGGSIDGIEASHSYIAAECPPRN